MPITKKSVFICVRLWLISLCFFTFPQQTKAQVRPVYDYGAIGLGQLLKRLNNTKSVMHIGAHPDDEDSGLLAYLARGENARTAYLSLTRGDGGQNIIGSELFESLGVIRTEELLQARRLDGAEQYFTRAFDYGFSKTLDEAKSKWDERIILCDAVRAIRQFRPLVVISRFSGTPADGHGQHQYAGYIAPLAVKAAGDANQCKDSGEPWQVLKFYVSQGFRASEKPTLSVNTGQYDPLLGRSYFEIAMEGRSQHKTQEQGVLELKGERLSGLNLIESRVPKVENEKSVFDGIDVSITGATKTFVKNKDLVGEYTNRQLSAIQQSTERALKEYSLDNPRRILPILVEGKKAVFELNGNYALPSGTDEQRKKNETRIINESDLLHIISDKWQEFDEAVKLAAGIQIEALSDRETAAPGEEFPAIVKVFFPADSNIKVKAINLRVRCYDEDIGCGATITKTDAPKDTNQNAFRRENANNSAYFNVKVSREAKATQPYWLVGERGSDLFIWDYALPFVQTSPFQTPLISASVELEVEGMEISFSQPLQFRYADGIRGEIRREVNIVPTLSVALDPKLVIVPYSEKAQSRRVVMTVINNSSKPVSGTTRLQFFHDEYWKCVSATPDFNLKNKGDKAAISFEITMPPKSEVETHELYGYAAENNGNQSALEIHTIEYPHIQTHRFYTETKANISILNLKVAPVKVGYITGSGDAVAEAIEQMGLKVERLGENDLTNGDLSKFDVIVVGIRAFQVRQDLISNNQKVLNYVKNGGKLIVQYQRPEYESLLPFPAKLGARVTDENAKVTILDSANQIFNFPNKITAKDFDGWVQERNLYAFSTFDANYKPLLEAHDANEAENKGGLVIAESGKGKYVYCSYAFFRQLPAGVPGAYRIFANLLALK